MTPIKQIIVINKGTEPRMRRGKEIAQGAHASMAWLSRRVLGQEAFTDAEIAWMEGSFRKIVCSAPDAETLIALRDRCLLVGVQAHLITDSGATEFGGEPTITALGIGPDYEDVLDLLTGHLPLY